jgi:hypothetical protein
VHLLVRYIQSPWIPYTLKAEAENSSVSSVNPNLQGVVSNRTWIFINTAVKSQTWRVFVEEAAFLVMTFNGVLISP